MATDHLGNTYKSLDEMCKHYGLSKSLYYRRLNISKWDLEKTLTAPVKIYNSPIDHLGNTYNSIEEMCDHYNISGELYNYRLRNGWDLEKTLTTPIRQMDKPIDHLGNVYNSIYEMCDHYGLTRDQYECRRKLGWDLEKTLITPIKTRQKPVDHLGNEFETVKDMCDYWDIPMSTYVNYNKNGLTFAEMVNKVNQRKNASQKPVDHLGNEFETVKDMCDYWDIPVKIYQKRINIGKTIQCALTDQYKTRQKPRYEDPIYDDQVSTAVLSRRYSMSNTTIRHRINKGYSMSQVVGISPIIMRQTKTKINKIVYGMTIYQRTKANTDVFECFIGDKFKIMSQEMIDRYCIEKYKEEHGIKD